MQEAGNSRTDRLDLSASGIADHEYLPRKAAYDLKKFRGKNIIQKIANSGRYQPTTPGIKTITALLVIREKKIKSLLINIIKIYNQKC